MALKGKLPAIRAEWLWDWQKSGTIEVESLLGTVVLIVAKNAKPSKTCYQQRDDKIIKNPSHYWLGQGVILVPRWDPLELHFDPIADDGVEALGLKELRQRGMYRVNEKILVLIYQHIEDALHFQRQQWHIHLETYATELQKISALLTEVEERALAKIFLGVVPEIEAGELGTLACRYKRRREKIHQILVRIAPRERAAEILVHALQQELQLAERGIRGILSSKSMKDLLAGVPTSLEGLRAYLVKIYLNLNQIKVRPIVRLLKLSQHYLRGGLGALAVGEIERFKHQLELAIKNLDKAQKSLQHPPEKIEKLKPTAT